MDKEQLMLNALRLPENAIAYYVSQELAARFPEKALVEGTNSAFDVEEYAQAGLCTVAYQAVIHNQKLTYYRGSRLNNPRFSPFSTAIEPADAKEAELHESDNQVWLKVEWRGHTFDVLIMRWQQYYSRITHQWILADSAVVARNFLLDVCRWNSEVRGEVLVFSNACWHKDRRLFRDIKGSTFDNLILQGNLKQDLREDLAQFFAARSTYESYGIPWKRGILLVGPPGNGKTHAIKAIINAMSYPCLYVKSFRAEHITEEENIRKVFEKARKTAPCILVLEDLDSLLNAQNRSFFLNELDGFSSNIGIIVVATTNHPERLDPAIVDRPSRFDRKYHFDLPALAERLAYITLWNTALQPALQLSEEGISRLAELTEGFSFAYLKELFLSSMMRWIAKQETTMEEVMAAQVNTLHEQMMSATTQPEVEEPPQLPSGRGFLTRMEHGLP